MAKYLQTANVIKLMTMTFNGLEQISYGGCCCGDPKATTTSLQLIDCLVLWLQLWENCRVHQMLKSQPNAAGHFGKKHTKNERKAVNRAFFFFSGGRL